MFPITSSLTTLVESFQIFLKILHRIIASCRFLETIAWHYIYASKKTRMLA